MPYPTTYFSPTYDLRYGNPNPAPAQNSTLLHVMSEEQARAYPVPLGQSMMFINDNQPYCYTKTAGLSQLEPPVFKIFEVREVEHSQPAPTQEQPTPQVDMSEYLTKAEFDSYREIIDNMQKIVKELNGDG